MGKIFTPYEGCAEDIESAANSCIALDVDAYDAGSRLLAAISEPKCGKMMRNPSTSLSYRRPTGAHITCTLPASHDGLHADETLNGAWS